MHEDLAYRRLLDWYYLNERPIPLDAKEVSRLISMRDCEDDVENVLKEFFELTDIGWINKRADEEIQKYHGLSDAGKRGAAKRWAKGADSHPIAPPIANKKHKPITNNHNKNTSASALLASLGVSEQTSNDFIALRKLKKAAITKTALDGIGREAKKANMSLEAVLRLCCERGWQGFKADWVKNNSGGVGNERANFIAEITGRNRRDDGNTIDGSTILD